MGTDSHTTMVNGLGVLGWGVGGIEAEAAMLGQPMSMLIPAGARLPPARASCPRAATATDLVLTVTEMLRERGVVGMFVEFYGAGLAGLPVADRATIGNMSPEFGSTCAIFPIDDETAALPGALRPRAEQIALVEAYATRAGAVARRALRGAHLHRHDRARPRRGRTEHRWTEAPAGPGSAERAPSDAFRDALSQYVPSDGEQADAVDEGVAESYPASDPPANGTPGHAMPASVARGESARGGTTRRCLATWTAPGR